MMKTDINLLTCIRTFFLMLLHPADFLQVLSPLNTMDVSGESEIIIRIKNEDGELTSCTVKSKFKWMKDVFDCK